MSEKILKINQWKDKQNHQFEINSFHLVRNKQIDSVCRISDKKIFVLGGVYYFKFPNEPLILEEFLSDMIHIECKYIVRNDEIGVKIVELNEIR